MVEPSRRRLRSMGKIAILAALISCWTTSAAYVVNHRGRFRRNPRTLRPSSSTLSCSKQNASEDIRSRLLEQLERLRERDRQTKVLAGDNLKVIYEDKYLVAVDKPSGVLCVPSEQGVPSLAQTVYETVDHNLSSYDRMVVHRLGLDSSGLVIFVKTMEALRGMNTLFRTRQVTRQYEVLVCGHVSGDEGTIDMPLMRDYMFPPFMRISTDEHQQALLGLDSSIVGKKLLEAPKPSQTRYEVVGRELLLDTDLPVSRLTLTSITGRTHQLNVHMAAFGHPIVGDKVYGFEGEAAENGGLSKTERADDGAASVELQKAIAKEAMNLGMCVHARCLQFRHPVTNEQLNFVSEAPF